MAEEGAQGTGRGGLSRLKELAWQALPAVAGAIGLAGFVGLVGGSIQWVRFWAAGLPADQAVKVMPNQELVTIGAVSLIAFTIGGLAVVLGVYLLDRNGNLTVPTMRGLVALGALEMGITLVFARVESWVYFAIGAWIFVTGVISVIVLEQLRPKLQTRDQRSGADNELLASLRAFHEADDLLADMQYASEHVPPPAGSEMSAQIRHAQRQRALASSRWERTLERWRTAGGEKPGQYSRWKEAPPGVGEVEKFLDDRNKPTVTPPNLKATALLALLAGGTALLIAVNETRWAGIVFAVVIVLVGIDFIVARATSKFAWYGAAVFFSVLLFGAALNVARVIREPEVQPVALVRKSDDNALCGVYITENDKRVYIGRVQPAVEGDGAQLGTGRIFWVPSEDVDVVTVGPLQGIEEAEKRAIELAAEVYADRAAEAPPKGQAKPVPRPPGQLPSACATASL